MTDQDMKNTCIICASDWADFYEQLRAACEARGVEEKDIFRLSFAEEDGAGIRVEFKHIDTSGGV